MAHSFKISFWAILCILLLSVCKTEQEQNILAQRGEIDLRGINWQSDNIVNLDGKWEFYWKQLLTPEDFDEGSYNPSLEYVPSN